MDINVTRSDSALAQSTLHAIPVSQGAAYQLLYDPNFMWDFTNKQHILKGQTTGVGGDRWNVQSVQSNVATDLVKVDLNGTLVYNYGAGGISGNVHSKIIPLDTLTLVTFNHCIIQNDNGTGIGPKDVAFSLGWNDNGNGASLVPNQPVFCDAWESNFTDGRGGFQFERHIGQTVFPAGLISPGQFTIRPITFIVDKQDGKVVLDHSCGSFMVQDDRVLTAGYTYVKFTSDGVTNAPSNTFEFLWGPTPLPAWTLIANSTGTVVDAGFGASIAGTSCTFNLSGATTNLTFGSGGNGQGIGFRTDGSANSIFAHDFDAVQDLIQIGNAPDPILGAGQSLFRIFVGSHSVSYNVQGHWSHTNGTSTTLITSNLIGSFTNNSFSIITNNATAATFGTDGSLSLVGSLTTTAVTAPTLGTITNSNVSIIANNATIATFRASDGALSTVGSLNSGTSITAQTLITANAAGTDLKMGEAAGSGNIGLWIGQGTPNFSNYTLLGRSTFTQLNCPTGGLVNLCMNNTAIFHVDDNGAALFAGTGSYGGGQYVLFMANCIGPPTTNPVGGGIQYIEAGALKYRGSSGTTTVLGPA